MNPLSNISYTNKDFNSIYTELLDVVKKLTYKWDPTISNESDPGVILLKLNAIIADKNNYNIDKNILEAFPETVTQEISARSLYKQLGYKMPWYLAGETTLNLRWVGTDENELTDASGTVEIPKYTLISDSADEFIYTTLDTISFNKHNIEASDIRVIEGIINTLTVSGREIIELSDLDYNNRIYFSDMNVAENGIFIHNSNSNDDDLWQMVDNLEVESLGQKVFEFGVDSRKELCYIQFPNDIHNLINSGLVIKYIVTNGASGNITARTLNKFYEDVTVDVNGESVVLNNEVIVLTNGNAVTNGKDPETLDDAFRNYKKVAGTFDTLVTVRDYTNAICQHEKVGNAIVTDRLNDIQSSYVVVSDNDKNNGEIVKFARHYNTNYLGYAKLSNVYSATNKPVYKANTFFIYENNNLIEITSSTDYAKYAISNWKSLYYKVNDINEDLQPYDLRLYALQRCDEVSTLEEYESTFKYIPYNSTTYNNIVKSLNDIKSIQHNFKDIVNDVPFMFFNVFPIVLRIIPHYRLNDNQLNELKVNINKSLFKILNSNKLDFGKEPDYDKIYDTIINCDSRIKVLIMDDFNYTTFARMYKVGEEFNDFIDIPLSFDKYSPFVETIDDKADLPTTYKPGMKLWYYVTGNKEGSDEGLYYYNFNTKGYVNADISIKTLRSEILAKNILAGHTPLWHKDSNFEYSVDQIPLSDTIKVDRITTSLNINPFKHYTAIAKNSNSDSVTTERLGTYELKANENLRFLAPSLIDENVYSNYVKFQINLNNNKEYATQTRTLSYNDYNNNTSKYKYKPITVYYEDGGVKKEKRDIWVSFVDFTTHTEVLAQPIYSPEITTQHSRGVTLSERRIYLYSYYLDNDLKIKYKDIDIVSYVEDGVTKYTTSDKKPDGKMAGLNGRTFQEIYDFFYSDYKCIDDDPNWFYNNWEKGLIVLKADLLPEDITETLDIHNWKTDRIQVTYTEQVYAIPANCDYELDTGECITFFYKEEDDDEGPYTYKSYGKGTIIKPSFVLRGQPESDNIIKTSQSHSEGTIPYDELLSSDYQKISNLYGENDLSGSKTIAIRKLNEIERKPHEHFIYFITNTVKHNGAAENDEYVITLNDRGEYILENDEYFICTNKDKTSFEIVGAGTIIYLENSGNREITNKAIPYNDITNKGVDAFKEYCNELSNTLWVKEQQVYNFSEKDIVNFSLNNESTIKLIEKDVPIPTISFNSGSYTEIENFDISYVSNKKTQPLPTLRLSGGQVWRAKAVLNISSSYDVPQKIAADDEYSSRRMVLNVVNDDSGVIQNVEEIKLEPTDTDKYLLISVQTDKVGGKNTDITYLTLNGKRTCPYVFMYDLNLLGSSTYQKNDDGSFLINLSQATYYNGDDDTILYPKIFSYSKGEKSYVLTIENITSDMNFRLLRTATDTLSSPSDYRYGDVNMDGKINIKDVTLIQKYISRYVELDETQKELADVNGKGGVTISDVTTLQKYLSGLEAGEHRIGTPYTNINVSSEVLTPINGDKSNTEGWLGKGTYYFYIESIPEDTNFTQFYIQVDKHTTNLSDTLLIKQLFKCERNEDFVEKYHISHQNLYDKLIELDIDKEFNYTHTVPQESLIKDPLDAKSFFNTYHVCNAFTLPKADLNISEKSATSITLINNR